MTNELRVFAPATVANVACGFDIFGFALELPGDEVVARFRPQPGVALKKITGDKGVLPLDPYKNTVGVGVLAFLEHCLLKSLSQLPMLMIVSQNISARVFLNLIIVSILYPMLWMWEIPVILPECWICTITIIKKCALISLERVLQIAKLNQL